MTTKKVKREAVLARRKKFLEENKQMGLTALLRDRLNRERKNYRDWEDTHEKKHGSMKWASDCPWCKDEQKALSIQMKE